MRIIPLRKRHHLPTSQTHISAAITSKTSSLRFKCVNRYIGKYDLPGPPLHNLRNPPAIPPTLLKDCREISEILFPFHVFGRVGVEMAHNVVGFEGRLLDPGEVVGVVGGGGVEYECHCCGWGRLVCFARRVGWSGEWGVVGCDGRCIFIYFGKGNVSHLQAGTR